MKHIYSAGRSFGDTFPNRLMICGIMAGAFILANYYGSILTAYITAPIPQPLIKSIYDLKDRPDIHLITDKNTNVDAIITVKFLLLHVILSFENV